MDDKKKMLVLGVLGAMFVGVGAFTFMPKGEEPAAEAKKPVPDFLVENEKAKTTEAAPNPQVVANLTARDPFKTPDNMVDARLVSTSVPQMPAATKRQSPPLRLTGGVKPFGLGSIPGLGGNGLTGDVKVEPSAPPAEEKIEEPQFSYTVGGVAIGARPAAVFKDGQGNQRLVEQGGALDGETTVIAVKLAYVEVLFHGKKLRLPVGGSVAKQ